MTQQPFVSKSPQFVLENIFAFSPNRDTLGGTSYFIVDNQTNILIDCPANIENNQKFLSQHGGVKWLYITHRSAIGKAQEIQKAFNCEILIQEQEAYLLPNLKVTTFEQEFSLSQHITVFWTPGHSPGSSCLYYSENGGVLFTGRHLLPNSQGQPVPLHIAKTFHWPRQLQSVKFLIDRFSQQTLQYICPGANTGALRGKRVIESAYDKLTSLDLEVFSGVKP
ncbi:MAG: MBL fold metallo-hydrolase [Okeania sp. SIO2G4]|uniref:MBL fold metallo-hydrolase n=1 Tax=unclassified Okeania TaxID=2634635 RepID=UPI0013B8A041|nr:MULTISPECIES: MBL fold metallo-hydrolase [unclassified Okeania]NEP73449.1 MBL fold metallo-hydrolase [Okeania sp. SIO2G5]NEP93160.1 MBL fold metallo-hydrolase [Okeania sp. SIO2F5]NEQ90600.1 MBL fold metallo-hydrolase [Okeania sp. SIO2G4]